ncbi:MAG: sigma 54-interacting transcriptional regulator [Candidatus Aminicenantales bacterium]
MSVRLAERRRNQGSSLGRILDLVLDEIPSDYGLIFSVDRRGEIAPLESQRSPRAVGDMLDVGVVREALGRGTPVARSRNPQDTTSRREGGGCVSWVGHVLCLPCFSGATPVGGLFLARDGGCRPFSGRDVEILAAFSPPVLLHLKRILRSAGSEDLGFPDVPLIVGRSAHMNRVWQFIHRVKNQEVPVFISGESGTGKELVAQAIHRLGSRRRGKFVALNCGAVPEHLLESELFGYTKGAFTGAVRDRPGLIEEAERGTFFLDEIGDLSPMLQAKLLRVLQEREIRRVGENRIRKVDVRFISATNKDIEREVKRGRFREDLYYRLKIVSLHIPPLRERREDIPSLVNHLVERFCREMRRHKVFFTGEALERLVQYSWPGNVRELQNEIQRCLVLSGDALIVREHHLSEKIQTQPVSSEPSVMDYFQAKAAFERKFLHEALARSGYNRTRTAARIGLSRQGLFKLMKKHGLLVHPKEIPQESKAADS